MPKFKGANALSDMQKWLEKNIHKVLNSSIAFENVLAETMIQAIWETVYDAYTPEQYNRREDEGGLADRRNIVLTEVVVIDGAIRVTMENYTQGNDSMRQLFITDTIVEGIKQNWDNPNGVWSEPRDFIAETKKMLSENPHELLSVIKAGLVRKGMRVKS